MMTVARVCLASVVALAFSGIGWAQDSESSRLAQQLAVALEAAKVESIAARDPTRPGMDYYLDEFTFRFNRRTSRHRGKLFYRLVQQAVAVGPAPYGSLVKHVRPGKRRRRHHGT